MGAPHNKTRYGETWPQYRIDTWMPILDLLRPYVVLSGGFAWHFMSPPGHVELKHAHDHKDLDLHVPPENVGIVLGILMPLGFQKVPTKYDRLPSEEEFRRYEKTVNDGEHLPFRLTIDFFVKIVPERQVYGWRVMEPSALLKLYGSIHSSDKCFAVQAATRLLAQGVDPVGHHSLIEVQRG